MIYILIAIAIVYIPVGLIVLAGIDYVMIKTDCRFTDMRTGDKIPLVQSNWPVLFWPVYITIPCIILFLGILCFFIWLYENAQKFCERVPVLDFPKLIALIHRQDIPKPKTF